MNRIFLAVLIVLIFSVRAAGQDPDTLLLQPEADPIEFVPLLESDTVYEIYGSDTVSQIRSGVRIEADTTMVEAQLTRSPTKAIMLALVLPGLGQAYNRKYFKMPIVWAAFAGVGYIAVYNTKQYKFYSKEYANNPDDTNERYLRGWRRNMELSYIGLIAIYALQVVDAYVDAQLFGWDVNEELSMGISPALQPLMVPGSLTGHAYGLTCSFNLKR